MSTKVRYGQTPIDMVIQGDGDATRLFEFAQLNGQSITDDLIAGGDVNIPVSDPSFSKIINIFGSTFFPASGDINSATAYMEGIGYWIIGQDFKVS